jgi:hypothetical protein
MAWRRDAYQEAGRRSVAEQVWSDVPVLATPQEDAVADGLVAPLSLAMFARAGAGAGTSADLTMARTVRSAPGLDPGRLAAAWNLSVGDAHQLLSGAEPTDGPAPAAPTPEENDR